MQINIIDVVPKDVDEFPVSKDDTGGLKDKKLRAERTAVAVTNTRVTSQGSIAPKTHC